jgi:catechol-2,3-dioxygenase
MNLLQIKETCLYCYDLEKAKTFYEGLLGLPVINYQPGKHLFLRAGNSVLLIFNPNDSRTKQSPPAHYGEGHQHFAFEVAGETYLDHKKEIQAKGITIIDTVVWKNGSESFYFNDPEGNVLEIIPEGIWD